MPYFSGHYRQGGSGFGVLASGIGRIAIPLARKFILPAAKRVGKELLLQSVPELVNVVSKKKSAKQALKNTISNTVKKQTGGSLALRIRRQNRIYRRLSKRSGSKARKSTNMRKTVISKNKQPKRSRSVSSLELKMIGNMLPTEATHSSLDLFEKPALLVTFDDSFCQKVGPVYSPNGPMREFEVAGDKNNFIDLQKIFLESNAR